eukprot:4248209-Amphidinium_carterae.1
MPMGGVPQRFRGTNILAGFQHPVSSKLRVIQLICSFLRLHTLLLPTANQPLLHRAGGGDCGCS